MNIKRVARRLMGERALGMLDFYRHPGRGAAWGGPFNGQTSRKRLFKAMAAALQPKAFVETGTYLGTTTEFLASFGKPVFSVERAPRAYGFARARLMKLRDVTLVCGDSRTALAKWFAGPLQRFADAPVMFYLDAHRNLDLPLAEELDIVFANCDAAVVMIDDFRVPWDAAYGYDDYGPGKVLNADYIAPAVAAYGLAVFQPCTPASEETGMRRGCAVVAREEAHGTALRSLALLRAAVAAALVPALA